MSKSDFSDSPTASNAGVAPSSPDIAPSDRPLVPSENQGSARKSRWRWHMRPDDDDEPQDWWFCSTAIPLLAATTGPLANVMSIAALVTSWRNDFDPDNPGIDDASVGFPDPKWCLALNGASLACGVVGNIFLLFNFTRRIRYIVALPATIILWYFATGILIGITVSMNEFVPPVKPDQLYSQGYWHAVIAAVLYLISSMALMLNMLGYFLGHYPQHFDLSDEQRNLILQTMMFFIWLAGGAAVFAKVEDWSYVDALYFCDVTILTVGFGDFYPMNDAGRGLVFPYSVGGIIILGLMVSSIRKFAQQIGSSHVIRTHAEHARSHTISHSVTTEIEYDAKMADLERKHKHDKKASISAPYDLKARTVAFDVEKAVVEPLPAKPVKRSTTSLTHGMKKLTRGNSRKPKVLLLREERDRFDQMRAIQKNTHKFKRYSALTMSFIAFGILWCVGAVGFWKAEADTQGLSYFQALYFCYVSLLTIGYGDLSPKSNAGKPLFIVWSLIAVPTMTILISDMGDTVIASFKRGTFTLADWTVLPKAGIWRSFVEKHPRLLKWLQRKQEEANEEKRIKQGFQVGPEDDEERTTVSPTLEDVAQLDACSDELLARKLAIAIRRTASDLKADPPRSYSYEEWAEYTHLIRFSTMGKAQVEQTEEEEGLVEWDWIGEESPMMAEESESEWVLDRLCESLNRYMRKQHSSAATATAITTATDDTAAGTGTGAGNMTGATESQGSIAESRKEV